MSPVSTHWRGTLSLTVFPAVRCSSHRFGLPSSSSANVACFRFCHCVPKSVVGWCVPTYRPSDRTLGNVGGGGGCDDAGLWCVKSRRQGGHADRTASAGGGKYLLYGSGRTCRSDSSRLSHVVRSTGSTFRGTRRTLVDVTITIRFAPLCE